MTQMMLFDESPQTEASGLAASAAVTGKPCFRKSDPVTSQQAAERMKLSGQAKTHAQIVLELVRQYPGFTGKQLAKLGWLEFDQIMRRTKELVSTGLIRYGEIGADGSQRIWPVE